MLNLAIQMNLAPSEAVALPSVVSCAARKLNMSEPAFLVEAALNAPLRAYLAEICATVTEAS